MQELVIRGKRHQVKMQRGTVLEVKGDQVFIREDSGQESSLNLVDWDFGCREGHQVCAFQVSRPGVKSDTYTAVYNLTLNEGRKNNTFLQQLHWPMHPLLALVIVIAGGFVTAGLTWVFGIPWLWWETRKIKRGVEDVNRQLRAMADSPSSAAAVTPAAVTPA